jgi:hypothetical protein
VLFNVPGGFLLWAPILNGFENQGQEEIPDCVEIDVPKTVVAGVPPSHFGGIAADGCVYRTSTGNCPA